MLKEKRSHYESLKPCFESTVLVTIGGYGVDIENRNDIGCKLSSDWRSWGHSNTKIC